MNWRRIVGAGVMVLGATIALAACALAATVFANFIEPDNAADAITTVLAVTAPLALGGLALLVLGRWIYGGWRTAGPVRASAGVAMLCLGVALAAGMGAMLALSTLGGIEPQERVRAMVLGAGLLAGAGVGFAGRRMRPAV